MDKDFWEYVRKKEVTFQIKGKNLGKALWYRQYIMGHLEHGLPLSPAVFKKFLSFFAEIDAVEMRPTDHKAIKAVSDFLSSSPKLKDKYWFKFSYEQKNPHYTGKDKPEDIDSLDFDFSPEYLTVNYTLKHLIYDVFATVNRITDIKKEQTDQFVKACYKAIEKHLEKNFRNDDDHEFFGYYKRVVLAALICSHCGWKFKKEIKPAKNGIIDALTEEDWFQCARHRIEELPVDKIRFHPQAKKKKPRSIK